MTHCELVNNVQIPAVPWVTSISIWNLYMSTSIILEGTNNWKQFILWSKEILYILWKTITAFTERQKLIKSWYYKFEPMPIFGKSQKNQSTYTRNEIHVWYFGEHMLLSILFFWLRFLCQRFCYNPQLSTYQSLSGVIKSATSNSRCLIV